VTLILARFDFFIKKWFNTRSLDSRRIFIVVLNLYGTRGDTKIWGENNFRAYEEVQHAEVSVTGGRWEGQKRTPLNRPLGE